MPPATLQKQEVPYLAFLGPQVTQPWPFSFIQFILSSAILLLFLCRILRYLWLMWATFWAPNYEALLRTTNQTSRKIAGAWRTSGTRSGTSGEALTASTPPNRFWNPVSGIRMWRHRKPPPFWRKKDGGRRSRDMFRFTDQSATPEFEKYGKLRLQQNLRQLFFWQWSSFLSCLSSPSSFPAAFYLVKDGNLKKGARKHFLVLI